MDDQVLASVQLDDWSNLNADVDEDNIWSEAMMQVIERHTDTGVPAGKFTQLCENLYIGNILAAKDKAKIEEFHITHVVNCAISMIWMDGKSYSRNHVAFLGLNAQDDESYPMETHIEESMEFLQDLGNDPQAKAFVHCVSGRNRSAFICASYMLLTFNIPLLQLAGYMAQKRGYIRGKYVLDNEGFRLQLVALARKHGLLSV